PPPTSTLFPYTTLFRSLESNAQSARALSDNFLQLYMVSVQQQSFPFTESRVITQAATTPPNETSPKTALILLAAMVGGSILAGLDRKSTRLNSSHVAIS